MDFIVVNNEPLRMVRRHAITILILHGGDCSPSLTAPQPMFEIEHSAVAKIKEGFTWSHRRSFHRPIER